MHTQQAGGLSKFVAKLERRSPLLPQDRDALLALPWLRQTYEARQDIVSEGDKVARCIMIETGFVSRTKTLRDGSRQIVAFGFPGDMVDLQAVLFAVTDHGLQAQKATSTISVAQADVLAMTERQPLLARALWRDTLIDAAIFRSWMTNLGQRRARERMSHFLLECAVRFEAIGGMQDGMFELPITQITIADALGLSLVHVNRSLQSLRTDRFISIKGHHYAITNRAAMIAMSDFNSDYLCIDASSPLIADGRTLLQ